MLHGNEFNIFKMACCVVVRGWESLPQPVLEALFSYLSIDDLRNCSLVCTSWYRFLNDENNDVWRLHCIRCLLYTSPSPRD